MKLTAIHVEHWRCIAKLELPDLGPGITILHGPNRTGKSSLVRALRSCLYDSDPTTTGEKFRRNIPWNSGLSPAIELEFEHGGRRYRVKKVFAGRSGQAQLHEHVSGQWKLLEQAPKEVTRRTRELLGAPTSEAGLNQLLWLAQGDVKLPEPDRLDQDIQKQLNTVLGVLITGRDLEFRNALGKRCERWFTASGGQKQKSRPVQLEKDKSDCQRVLLAEETRFRDIELSMDEQVRCQDQLPQLQSDVSIARQERDRLQSEQDRCRERRRLFHEAELALDTVKKAHEAAGSRLEKLRQARTRQEEAGNQLTAVEVQIEGDEKASKGLADEWHSLSDMLQSARQAEETHQRQRDDLDDRRALVTQTQQIRIREPTVRRAREMETEIGELEERLRTSTAPNEAKLKQLRKNRQECETLRAQLQAAALKLTATVEQPRAIELEVDGQPAQPIQLLPGTSQSWPIRQRAEIGLPDWGHIQVARATEAIDLEQAARDLGEKERVFRDAVQSYGENPDDAQCLDRLAERRVQRETWSQRLEELHADLQELAPRGRGMLESQLAEIRNEQSVLLARRADLASWQPDQADVEEQERTFKRRAADLKRTREEHERSESLAKSALATVDSKVQEGRAVLAGARAKVTAATEELARHGKESELEAALTQAATDLQKAAQRVTAAQLTPEEQTIDQRLADAGIALSNREQRLREVQDRLRELLGELKASEGLHLRRADAKAALRNVEQALAHEMLEAEAHRLLRDLFDASRDNQVRQVMSPISARLLDWCKHLGLAEYRDFCFGDKFLPEGLRNAEGPDAATVPLDEESYGTEEQLSLLIRLALGGLLASDERAVAILDDPLAHADPTKHRRILDILKIAAEGNPALRPPAGPLQILVLTSHPDRFDYLPGAKHIDLARLIVREP